MMKMQLRIEMKVEIQDRLLRLVCPKTEHVRSVLY